MSEISIEYQTLVPGRRHFNCERIHGLLDTTACAARWASAMRPDADGRCISCKRCPIGRRHHAELHPERQSASGKPERAPLCIRCGRPATRLVGGELCVSCFNRAREWLKGADRRGNAPLNYRPPIPRSVGVIDAAGAPAWVPFQGQNPAESVARACRAGYRLHGRQPGRTHWCEDLGRFVYIDEDGRVLVAIEIDGRIEHIPVDRLRHGECPAPVALPTILLHPEAARDWLEASGEGAELGADWQQIELGCGECCRAMIHARRRGRLVETRCGAGCC